MNQSGPDTGEDRPPMPEPDHTRTPIGEAITWWTGLVLASGGLGYTLGWILAWMIS